MDSGGLDDPPSPASASEPALGVDIHKVVIVTAMSEAEVVNKIGLTIFANDATTIPQDGALSKTAVDTMTRRLSSARPNW